jgi:hypothetical protein
MIAVRVMQASVDQIVGVIAMTHCLMTACRTMLMRTMNFGGAVRRVPLIDLDHVILDAPTVQMLQLAVLDVIGVVTMPDGCMAAIGAVLMADTHALLLCIASA